MKADIFIYKWLQICIAFHSENWFCILHKTLTHPPQNNYFIKISFFRGLATRKNCNLTKKLGLGLGILKQLSAAWRVSILTFKYYPILAMEQTLRSNADSNKKLQ